MVFAMFLAAMGGVLWSLDSEKAPFVLNIGL